MATVLYPWQILVTAMAGWITRQQDAVIEYLREENGVLKQQLGRRIQVRWPETWVENGPRLVEIWGKVIRSTQWTVPRSGGPCLSKTAARIAQGWPPPNPP
jgi:hypothetical protein